MKKTTSLVLLLIAVGFTCYGQSSKQCCHAPTATASFASLGSDAAFRNSHESPSSISYSQKGKMISFPTPDGKNANAYLVASPVKSDKYLFVIHEWWGLNDFMKLESDMFSDSLKNVNVIALDLYDGKIATNAEDAGKVMQSMEEKRANNIIRGALNYAGKDAKIATIGWCFGGGWALQAALAAGKQGVGCVMYYGSPETDVEKLKTLNGEVIFIWANQDQWINEKMKNEFVSNMQAAGKKLTVKEYTADHAFANPSNPKHDPVATADAMKLTLNFLRRVLK